MAAPSTLIQLIDGKKTYGIRHLFENAGFSINEDEHVGVIGPNGAGKTTLFKILLGDEHLDHGEIIKSQSLRLGHLSQHDHWKEDESGNDYLERVSTLPIWEVKSRGRELQVTEDIFNRPITSLSGGYRMRIKLIGLLGQDPNLMLLDEPTNYLDLETTLLLERFLQNYRGAFLLISHDREFLRRTTDHILEVEAGDMTKYNGNIDDYFEQKELLRNQLEAMAASQADKKKAVLDFVAKFGAKATKAKQAQSRLRTLDKMETIELKALPVSAQIRIPSPRQTGKLVMKIKSADFGYGEKTILNQVNLEINRGDHVAVVGLNGAGKSTLLKGLAATLAPLNGSVEYGYQVEMAIYNQHVVEVLNPNDTVFDSLRAAAGNDITRQEILNLAGSLLFSGDLVEKRIRVLSGGEKSRVCLGRILLQRAPCILLDEPTNHLDFQTVEALSQALNQYEGTVIVVSHERSFIRRVGSKILEVSHGKVSSYNGTYDEYVWNLQRRLVSEENNESEISSGASQKKLAINENKEDKNTSWAQKKEKESKKRSLERKISQCETDIAKFEAENIKFNDQISSHPDQSMELVEKMSQNSLKIKDLENLWMELSEQRDQLE